MGKFPCFPNFGYLETVPMENLAILKMGKFPCFNSDTRTRKGYILKYEYVIYGFMPSKKGIGLEILFLFWKTFYNIINY